jgi:hypothetical protein
MKKRNAYTLFLVTIAVSFAVISPYTLSRSTVAQETRKDFHMLIAELDQRMTSDETLQVAIRLHTPIVPDENVLVVPDTDSSDDITRDIAEIGEDFICFDVIGGSARFTECVPLSNIASIRWLE